MENNADPQQDLAGGTACSSRPAELSEKKAIGGLKNTTESCKNSEATTAVAVDCSRAAACVDNQKSNNNSAHCSSLPVKDSVCQSGSVKSNGMGQTQPGSAGGGDVGDTTKFVNKTIETPAKTAAGIIDVMKAVDNDDSTGQQKISQASGTCQDEKTPPSSTSLSKAAASSDSLAEEPSGSDRSAPGESLSITSLESFSNLNQSDNSEGADDRVLALALQTDEYDSAGGDAKLAASIKGDYILDAKPKEISEIQRLNYEQKWDSLALPTQSSAKPGSRMDPQQFTIFMDLLRETLTAVMQGSARAAGPDLGLQQPTKMTAEDRPEAYLENMSDAMAVLHKLQTGLDVNVKFTGVRVFEYTPECIVFDLLDIPLYHGWLVDPQINDIVKAVGNCSYNQLVEKIIISKQSNHSELVGEAVAALVKDIRDLDSCGLPLSQAFPASFLPFQGQLYLLVTDQGFLTEEKVVWESLHNVDGDGNFCDSEFHLRPPSGPETVYRGQQDQIDQASA
ncbi:UNVERIFIED_CONTAM: hypothetical protein FKN15_042275 [Acipenser sinensis]